MTKKKKEYIPVFGNIVSAPSDWEVPVKGEIIPDKKLGNKVEWNKELSELKKEHKEINKMLKKTHKIGKHGAIGWETQDGSICAECGKKIKR